MEYRYRHWTKYCLPLAVLFCLILPSLKGTTWASNDSTDVTDQRLHYIVRHWHADGTHEDTEDDDGYLEKEGDTITVRVKEKEGETFSGFATAAGHEAVARHRDETNPENSYLTISYQDDIHLAKVHVYYKESKMEKVGSTDLGAEETAVDPDGTKLYNTAEEGLHTDKTAEVLDEDQREFQLTLESWFVGANKANVGMVLDASGSMAFTSDELKPIQMSDEQIARYSTMTRISQEDVNQILNPHYTDNSKLGYSGYTYFVYDPGDQKKEFVPIGYWDGTVKAIEPEEIEYPNLEDLIGYYPFTQDDERYNEVDVAKGDLSLSDFLAKLDPGGGGTYEQSVKVLSACPPKVNGVVNMKDRAPKLSSSNAGFQGTGKALDLAQTYRVQDSKGQVRQDAARLDVSPEFNTFTISFAVKGTDSKPVVWMGDSDQKEEGAGWYAIYVDPENGKTKVSSGIGVSTDGNDPTNNADEIRYVAGSFEGTEDWAICTYVFEENGEKETKVTIYVDGKRIESGSLDNIQLAKKENTVTLLGGSAWGSDFGGNDWGENEQVAFLVDELLLYEEALNGEQVEAIYNEMQKDASADAVYAAASVSDPDQAMAKVQNADTSGDGEGWYYVTSGNDWDEITNEELLTAKRYQGIPANEVIFNQAENRSDTDDSRDGDTGDYIYTRAGEFTWHGDSVLDTESTVTNWNGSILFFIDTEGYLRCFFNSGRNQKRGDEQEGGLNTDEESWTVNDSYCSYVYKKEDLQSVKTETLQRALGAFVTKLSEVSPDSQVSAVRFSTDNITDPSQLVLQDWTTNTMDSTGMLGLRRGDRTVTSYDPEEGDATKLYNYVLTGDTATYTGLNSYLELLDSQISKDDDSPKSLIIFTDGKDTTLNDDGTGGGDAIKLANKLKEKGYTIYCVMLQSAGNPLESAQDFLEELSSGDDSSQGEYVFSAKDVESLTEVFTQTILDKVVNNLPGYTVRDYIDPRFDLVDASGTVIYLKSDGIIEMEGENIPLGEKGKKIRVSGKMDEDVDGSAGDEAWLFYDESEEMYYLEWREQTIPGCKIKAERLNVWKSQIRVRAKEDFLGGNAVLSNGNDAQMNMVYYPNAENPSSGTDDVKCEIDPDTGTITHYPSRGFPRTTVNVGLLNLTLKDAYNKIYMGECITPEEALEELAAKVKDPVYYEYLDRYMNWLSRQADTESRALKEQLANGDEIRIPYYYLPDIEDTNQAGAAQPYDPIGWLTYQWKECDGKGVPKSDAVYIPYETTDTTSKYYQLYISYSPTSLEERERENQGLIHDSGMQDQKEAVGSEQNEIRALGIHQTDIVRGELVAEARVMLSDLQDLTEKMSRSLDAMEKMRVIRSYQNKVESFEMEIQFSYTADELKSLLPDADGYVSIYSQPTDPLPIGIYTVQSEQVAPFPFLSIKGRKIEDGNGHFSEIYTEEQNESAYAAPSIEDEESALIHFYLGVPEAEDVNTVNLDAQLGHVVVTYGPLKISATSTPVPTETPYPVPTGQPTASPTPMTTAKSTVKPTVKPTEEPAKVTSNKTEKESNTTIDGGLPSGNKSLDDPDTGDPAEPYLVLIWMVVSGIFMTPFIIRKYWKKKSK